MKSAKDYRDYLAGLLAVVVLVGIASCTVTPAIPKSDTIAFDGSDQNAGVIGWTNHLAIITPYQRDRYNSLISIYGARFVPPVTPDFGVSPAPPNYLMTKQALICYLGMSRWWRSESPASRP